MKKLLAIALTCFLLPAPVMARDPWQPDQALGIVSALLKSLNQIVEMSRDDQMQPDAVKSKKAHAALVDIRFMVDELERLDLALSAGKSKIQTLAQYQKISNLRYSVQDYYIIFFYYSIASCFLFYSYCNLFKNSIKLR